MACADLKVRIPLAFVRVVSFAPIRPLRDRGFRGSAITIALVGLGFGGCAQSPPMTVSHGKEYFPSSVYGAASRRVIADGQPIPRGGGQYLVGKPYTIAGRTYYPSERRTTQIGYASWYGDAFHGRLTANGEIYDRDSFTAASPTMPLPSYVRVTNLRNNYSMIVRVNDRGPYASNRIMDVSRRVAEALDFKRYGTTQLKVEYVGRAGMNGSDDAKLLATLRTDGPARFGADRTMVADASPRARVASVSPYAPVQRPMRIEPDIDRHVPPPSDEANLDPLPLSRPMDLGTIPGAATPIRAPGEGSDVDVARAPDN
jgi:rare lipoprotein A